MTSYLSLWIRTALWCLSKKSNRFQAQTLRTFLWKQLTQFVNKAKILATQTKEERLKSRSPKTQLWLELLQRCLRLYFVWRQRKTLPRADGTWKTLTVFSWTPPSKETLQINQSSHLPSTTLLVPLSRLATTVAHRQWTLWQATTTRLSIIQISW